MLGAGLGLLAALGLLTAIRRLPVLRRPTLDDRLAPYLRDASSGSRLLEERSAHLPFPNLERLLAPTISDAARLIERTLGGSSSVRRQLVQAGSGRSVEEFRAEQVVWGGAGFALVLGTLIAVVAGGRDINPLAAMVACGAGGAVGILLRDYWLGREVARREQRMMQEFPTIAELLALAVTAGEGAVGALERVTRTSTGELARELARALADARSGSSLVQALQGIADRTSLAALVRFVDGVAVAVERGTPLADVLRAQAVDVREAGKRALLESGGRKEIAMMVPVVFLILPVTIAFALYPGLITLNVSG